MALKKRQTNGVTILEPIGSHTYGSKDFDLKETIKETLGAGVKKFIVNMGGIHNMDSSGLGELVLIHQMFNQKNGILKLSDLTNEVSSNIKLTRLNVKFDVFHDEAKAIRSFT